MGALPRPAVPDGPARTLFDELHALHHRAGWPSLRTMAKEVGCSHTTISSAFSGPTVPRWGLLELIVETLQGDAARFHQLWLAATSNRSGPAGPGPAVPLEPAGTPTPRELPADVPAFTGRADHLDALDRLLPEAESDSSAVVVTALCGTAGVGKTALAVHWAHRVAHAFPDGQLFLNLRGYGPERPVPAADALELLLRSLGVDGAAVPHDPAERAARLRTLLADRRVLLLLDNVHSIDQVRDLLPGSPSCLVLITSRESMPALVARHGAVRINLDLLPLADAVALLAKLIGARVAWEPDAATELAVRCARLPLALRVAAELAAARPMAELATLAAELRDEPALDLLAAGEDEYTAVRTVFSWSCRHLPAAALSAFHLLGLHPGQDTDIPAAAALIGAEPAEARRLLGTLVRAHLVDERVGGRFGMHDLLRAYAAEHAMSRADRDAALNRLYDHYLHTAGSTDTDAGRAWLAAESDTLLAIAAQSPAHAVGLSARLAYQLDAGAHYRVGITLHGLALRASVAVGDRTGEADARNRIGVASRRIGLYREAREHHDRALAIHRDSGDLAGQAAALHGIGTLAWRAGRHIEASTHLAEAMAIHQRLGDPVGEGSALYALGTVYRQLGRYRDALDHQQRALAIERRLGDAIGESRVLNNLGTTLERLGDDTDAVAHFRRALEINRQHGNRLGEGVALTNLGNVNTKLGNTTDALRLHQEALRRYEEIGYRVGVAEALVGIGEVYLRTGEYHDAEERLGRAVRLSREIGEVGIEIAALITLGEAKRSAGEVSEAGTHYTAALALAEQTGDRYEQARALTGLGHLAPSPTQARQSWAAALAIFTELGVPDGDQLRAGRGPT